MKKFIAPLLAVIFLATPVYAQETKAIFPPISSPATDEYIPGKFIWADLITRDMDLVSSFYGEVFGWDIQ